MRGESEIPAPSFDSEELVTNAMAEPVTAM